jgi:arabinofuranan 3-O-arabinosyltransferase
LQATGSAAQRSVRVLGWQPDNRSVTIGPGAASYLEIHENFNAGWTATLNGRALTAVRLDGWQQAFMVPAGRGGAISLSYSPAALYHAGLVVSALALALLAAIAIGCGRRRSGWWAGRRFGQSLRRSLRQRFGWRRAVVGVGRTAGPSPASIRRPQADRPIARRVVLVVPLAVIIWLAGGPMVLAVPLLAGLGWWRPRWLPPMALGSMLLAGVVAASPGSFTAMGSGAFGGLAQAFALVALAAALMPAIARTATGITERSADLGEGRP